MTTMDFLDAEIPPDTVPSDLTDVEFPCEVCGNEAGPYGGRGPKPKRCDDHRKNKGKSSVRKVTGNAANLAAQATEVLQQLNGIIAIGSMALGLNSTAAAIAAGNETFAERAHAALLTDPALCQLILKGGVKSAKISLGIAYAGLGVQVIPTAIREVQEKREEARLRAEQE